MQIRMICALGGNGIVRIALSPLLITSATSACCDTPVAYVMACKKDGIRHFNDIVSMSVIYQNMCLYKYQSVSF